MLRVACLQLTTTPDVEANLADIERMAGQAAAGGCQLLALPEVADFIGETGEDFVGYAPPAEDHPALERLRALAARLGVWILVGSVSVRVGERAANRSYLIDAEGGLVAHYDKIHLFDIVLPDGETHKESSTYEAGERAVAPVTPWGRMGLSICYDLRFPQLYRRIAQAGARILFVPAAFTVKTGQLHWHTLLRARAIETGCYVLAPAQCGNNVGERWAYGHSLIVDPWGRILADAGEEPGIIAADLDLDEVERFRASIPSPLLEKDFGLSL